MAETFVSPKLAMVEIMAATAAESAGVGGGSSAIVGIFIVRWEEEFLETAANQPAPPSKALKMQ